MTDLMVGLAVVAGLVVNIVFLYRLSCHMQERNRILGENTSQLRAHDIQFDAIARMMIALYPDHDTPERPSKSHKLFAINEWADATRQVAELRKRKANGGIQ